MYKISKNTHLLSLGLILIGVISTAYAFITDIHAAWTSLLFNNYFFLGIPIADHASGQTYRLNLGKYNTGLNFIIKYKI